MQGESRVRSRTRRAILRAAAGVLARDRTATLADIAEAAEVGRSTLHRYFADRDELIRAAAEDSAHELHTAVSQARIDEGPAREAMRRLVMAHLDLGDRLIFLFGDPHVMRQYGVGVDGSPSDAAEGPFRALVERGQAEGVFDAQFGAEWILQVLWAIVYTGVEQVEQGRMSRLGAAATVVRTFEKAIGADR
jgi:AcrR family transcriptional regulator